ncbi:cilia- and flagella-associated protein 69-like isoform X1 [Tubulanus polymorphus]|uniref:cilia- and flagella-associated protein 69-like isoform X1 n=1 Tax=Tubulanus polymorphus TaxID=672921 RepID=UPI003DA5AFDD
MAAMQTQTNPRTGMSSSPANRKTMIQAVVPDKLRIPVVGHMITDDDMGILRGVKLQPVNLAKIVKLLVDPHSSMMYDRHVCAMKKLGKHYNTGFLMKDLVQIFRILNICADRAEDQPLYIESMCDLLKICGLPLLKEKTSDELSYEQIAIESISQLGYLMRVPSKEVRLQICSTLVSFYCEEPTGQNIQKHQATGKSYNQKIVEKSNVSETLVKSLSLLESDLEVRRAVLNVLQHFSKDSEFTCNQMLLAQAAERLCTALNENDPSGQCLFRSVDILWNLLENGDKSQVSGQLGNIVCIKQLQEAFVQQVTQGYSHYDRQLRNDLLVITSLLIADQPDAPFVETGFVKMFVLLATFQEVKSHHALVRHLRLGTGHEDFEFKKLLINILVLLSRNTAAVPILSEGRVLLALFGYVRENENTTSPSDYTAAQFEEIQLHAMAALCTLCPLMIDDYMTCQGSTRLLLLLEWCVGTEDYGGHGNSFHAVGGRGNKRAQMRHCLRLLRSIISTGEEVIIQDLVDQGAINQITGILSNVCKSDEDDDAIDVEMQCDMLFILSNLCEGDMHRRELFGREGVEVLTGYMKMNPRKISSGLGHHRLMLSTVDAIWCAVVGCYSTEDIFLETEGVFLLLDLLETCPKSMHNLILGCLLDLTENPKCLPHINTWRGQGDKSAAHLMCELWREEEREMGVPREESGAIADFSNPLVGALQAEMGIIPLPSTCPSHSIVDVSENLRAKIYSLFTKLGFVELPGLTTDDHITLSIVERYYDFKLGEVWTEVVKELEMEGVRPVTPDQECLETITRAIEERAQGCALTQGELLEAQKQQDLLDEQEHYAEIRENYRQTEKALTDFADYVARTSNYGLLKIAKQRQQHSIEASRIETKHKEKHTFHATDLSNIKTTTFSGPYVAVESTPAELTGGHLVNYDEKLGTLKPRKIPLKDTA